MKYTPLITLIASAAAQQQTISATAGGNEDFSTLVAALSAAELVSTFDGEDEFTVFAPTNAAFNTLPENVVPSLLKAYNKDVLTDLLKYHVVQNEFNAETLIARNGQPLPTLQGGNITVTTNPNKVNEVELDTTDIECTNGIIHSLKGVLNPNLNLKTITATAQSNPDLSTLVSALVEANIASLFDEVSDDGFTVFAPTNDAFEKTLNELNIDAQALLARDDLADILKLHVVPGVVLAESLQDGQEIETYDNSGKLTYNNGMLSVDGGASSAKITNTDIRGLNGVVHTIDTALLTASANPDGSGASTYVLSMVSAVAATLAAML